MANTNNTTVTENQEQFDYSKAIAELEKIATVVEDPATSLDDIGKYMARSKQLVAECREYLRTVRSTIEEATSEK